MPHSFTDLPTHAIFSTKERQPLIDNVVRRELLPYVGGIVKHIGGKALLVNGATDHIHMLLRLPADVRCRMYAAGEGEFMQVGARALAGTERFSVADRICGVFRQFVAARRGVSIYPRSGNPSREGDVCG